MNGRRKRKRSVRAAVFRALLAIVVAGGAATAAAGAEEPRKGRLSSFLWDIALDAGAEAAAELLVDLMQQSPEEAAPTAARYFDVPDDEYETWPRGRRLVLRAIFATKEDFRKRTIALVKTLDTEDWELIERAAAFVVRRTVLLSRQGMEGTLSFDGLPISDMVELEAMGIVGSTSVLGVQTTFKPHSKDRPYRALRFGNQALLLRFNSPDDHVDWPSTPITVVGQELLPLLLRAPDLVEPDREYLRALGEALAKQGLTVELWEVSGERDAKIFRLENQVWAIPGTP